MRLLLDMNVPVSIAGWLRDQGHDAVHIRQRDGARMADHDVFAVAAREARVLVTFDLDFGEIVGSVEQQSCGVLLLRLRRIRSPHLQERLKVALTQADAALTAGAIVIVEDARIRIRSIPTS
ncbi:MAG: DUF5615 family PIN-like protein [Acetobacteraceae bacterium]